MIDPNEIPTQLACVARRVQIVGPDSFGDTFLTISYLTEALIKNIAIALLAGTRASSSSTNIGHKYAYELVHADGLGTWETVINNFTSQSHSAYLPSDFQPLTAWLTKSRNQTNDAWAKEAINHCATILNTLESDNTEVPKKPNVRHIIKMLVRIRNKTKAHGAVGLDFYETVNPLYLDAINLIIANCPICSWDWFHLSVRPQKNNVRAIQLRGLSPKHVPARESELMRPLKSGVHLRTSLKGHLLYCGDLIVSNHECTKFSLPNGGYNTSTGNAEYLDYSDGKCQAIHLPQYIQQPAPLPPSATEGSNELDIFSNTFGNLPLPPELYIPRNRLETELIERLTDKNHTIITLHGRGGIGKTSLALHVAHKLSEADPTIFEHVLWMSARDLELRPSGATEVRRAVRDLEGIARAIGRLLGIDESIDSLALLLQSPDVAKSRGILFVFDNFETLDDPRAVHQFLDTHSHIPNKILITSRERAFKGDFPIEVGGMERDEASLLMRQEAISLRISSIIDPDSIDKIYEYSDGHAYVMRVLLGEIAKEGCMIPLKSIGSKRGDLLSAVFERSFNKLSDEGRWVFLCVANWRSLITELSLLVVIDQRNLDADSGIDECLRLSLIQRHELPDGLFAYDAPELARVFGRKKLEGDPDRLLIQEDIESLRQFGVLNSRLAAARTTYDIARSFVERCINSVDSIDEKRRDRIDSILEHLADLWPPAWLDLVRFRRVTGCSADQIALTLRRATEEMPHSKIAWLQRSEFAAEHGEDLVRITSLISAVESDPKDVGLVRDTALELTQYIQKHKSEIPPARRGIYLKSVRVHMEQLVDQLDPSGLSRLAWLFLLEGDEDGAWKYANQGLAKDVANRHCLSIVENLDSSGYKPPR